MKQKIRFFDGTELVIKRYCVKDRDRHGNDRYYFRRLAVRR